MIQFFKNKWEDVYSYFDHLWWRYEEDICLFLLFIVVGNLIINA